MAPVAPQVKKILIFYSLANRTALSLYPQVKYLHFPSDSRWQPIKQDATIGIIMMRDTQPGEPFELAMPPAGEPNQPPAADGAAAGTAAQQGAAAPPAATADEPTPPEPFEYNPDA